MEVKDFVVNNFRNAGFYNNPNCICGEELVCEKIVCCKDFDDDSYQNIKVLYKAAVTSEDVHITGEVSFIDIYDDNRLYSLLDMANICGEKFDIPFRIYIEETPLDEETGDTRYSVLLKYKTEFDALSNIVYLINTISEMQSFFQTCYNDLKIAMSYEEE